LNLAEELGNVSKACQMMGVSRDTFYRYQAARDEGGVDALLDRSRSRPNLKNRIDPRIEASVLEFTMEYPAHGQVRVSNELRKQGVFVSVSGVRSIWLRHKLQSRQLRLRALESKVAEEGIILTEAQVAAMERAKAAEQAHGAIETEHPGYPGIAGYVLRGHDQGDRPHLPADVRRYLQQGGVLKAVHDQDADHCS
jgi:transposase